MSNTALLKRLPLIEAIRKLKPNTIGIGEGYDDAIDDVITLIRQDRFIANAQAAEIKELVACLREVKQHAKFGFSHTETEARRDALLERIGHDEY